MNFPSPLRVETITPPPSFSSPTPLEPMPTSDRVAYLILATAITIICFYVVDPSWWWVLDILVMLFVLGLFYIAISPCCKKGTNKRRRFGSSQNFSVPTPRSGTSCERTSLLPFHSQSPALTPLRGASPQLNYYYQCSSNSIPTTPHTERDNSFRATADHAPLRYTLPTPPAVASEARRTLPSNLTLTERQSVSVQPTRNTPQPARNTIPAVLLPVARREIDGAALHEDLAAQVGNGYSYDQNIATEGNRNSEIRLVMGYFRCYNCRSNDHPSPRPRIWNSNAICVEIWISPSDHRYRTRLHSQKCNRCNFFVEPDVLKGDYVTVVVWVLDRYTNQTSEVQSRQPFFRTGPHLRDMCSACLRGICPLRQER